MEKKLCVALTMTLACFRVESAPNGLHDYEFDQPDSDLFNLSYQVEGEDLDDLSKLLDDASLRSNAIKSDATDGVKPYFKTSGLRKKNLHNKGLTTKHNIKDLKKLFKSGRLHDEEAYDDDNAYAFKEGNAAKAVSVDGNEERKYRKGIKTRGFHRIQHKDEYKKDKEIYEDDETNGVIKKIGAKKLELRFGAGTERSKGNFHHDHNKSLFGKESYLDKGNSDKQYSGYSDSQGFDAYFNSDSL